MRWMGKGEPNRQPTNTVHFELPLDDARVAKNFSIHPERGRMIPSAAKVKSTGGVQWKRKGIITKDGNFIPIGEPKLVRAEVMTSPIVTMKIVRRSVWMVTVNQTYKQAAIDWLMKICGPQEKAKKRKSRRGHTRTYIWGGFN